MTTWQLVLFHLQVFGVVAATLLGVVLMRNLISSVFKANPSSEYTTLGNTTMPQIPTSFDKGPHMPGRTKSVTRFTIAFLLLLGTASTNFAEAANNWTSFHNGGNTSVEAMNLPTHWSPKKGIAWMSDLPGYGQSAPVVWKDHIYVTAVEGPKKETCHVLAFSKKTGKPVWKRKFEASVKLKNGRMVSRAAPTPLVDDAGVYVFYESGDLRAFTHHGKPRWKRAIFDDDKNAFQNGHGYGGSPCQTTDAVVLQVDHKGPSYLLAVSKSTGKNAWKTARKSRASWTSPHVTKIGDKQQIIVSSNGTVDGYDAITGKQLWSHSGISGNTIPSATVQGNIVFVGAALSRRSRDADSAAASNRCLKIDPDSKAGHKLVWKAKKAISYYVSPLVHRGLVYYVNRGGAMYCLDAKTGEQVYAKRVAGSCWAQPIAAGDYIYFFGKDGVTTVIKSGRKFEKVADNRLWSADNPPSTPKFETKSAGGKKPRGGATSYFSGPVVYGVAAVDGAFFVRNGTRLYCIRPKSSR